MESDRYRTIAVASEPVLFKDKNSKFYGYAFPVETEEAVKTHLENLKKEHHNARHWCYAYQIGAETISYRANDDGEPNNSAGMPIYGQIQSFELTNILVVVVRYFGGTKLGVSGLINAYRSSAQMALETCEIITKTIDVIFSIQFDYINMNKVMRIIKEKNLHVVGQHMALDCKIRISVRKNESDTIFNLFSNLFGVTIKAV